MGENGARSGKFQKRRICAIINVMKVKIKKGDHLPAGEYELTNRDKIERAKNALPPGAINREVFIEYDKIAGRIVDSKGNVLPPQSFWKLEVRRKIVRTLAERERAREHSRYGEFIIQTNYVQYLLILLILVRARRPSTNKLWAKLERLPLGGLLEIVNLCTQDAPVENKLVQWLRKYKDARDALAHKMFTTEKLTPKECEAAIKSGKAIIQLLNKILVTKTLPSL